LATDILQTSHTPLYMHNSDTSLDQGVSFPKNSLVALVKIFLWDGCSQGLFVHELLYPVFVINMSLENCFLVLGKLSSNSSNFPNYMQVGGRLKKLVPNTAEHSGTNRKRDHSSKGLIVARVYKYCSETNNLRIENSGKHF
jgi:hypothetical protein